jgi:hypothetical protein
VVLRPRHSTRRTFPSEDIVGGLTPASPECEAKKYPPNSSSIFSHRTFKDIAYSGARRLAQTIHLTNSADIGQRSSPICRRRVRRRTFTFVKRYPPLDIVCVAEFQQPMQFE